MQIWFAMLYQCRDAGLLFFLIFGRIHSVHLIHLYHFGSSALLVSSTHSIFLPLCITEVQAWGRRSSTSATLPAAGRFMGRRLTSELTCAGTAGRDPSSATGCSAGRDSPGATSYRDTGGHTQVRPGSQALALLNMVIQSALCIFIFWLFFILV